MYVWSIWWVDMYSNIQLTACYFLVELKSEDVCKWHTFQANCSENEVIIVDSARYGRIKSGRCIKIEIGERPCFVDVLPYFDSKCGGRRTCELTIPTKDLDTMLETCQSQRIPYLEISYHCQEGEHADFHLINASFPVDFSSTIRLDVSSLELIFTVWKSMIALLWFRNGIVAMDLKALCWIWNWGKGAVCCWY